MWLVLAVVVVAIILIVVTGRSGGEEHGPAVVDVADDGLRLAIADDPDAAPVVPWDSVFHVTVTARRGFGRTRWGFEVLTEERGAVHVDGSGGLGEAFLANAHRLPGFDHDGLLRTLVQRRGSHVCFQR